MLIPLLTVCSCYPTSTSYVALNNYTCPPRRPTLHILRSRSRTENRRRSRFLDDSPLLRFSLFVLLLSCFPLCLHSIPHAQLTRRALHPASSAQSSRCLRAGTPTRSSEVLRFGGPTTRSPLASADPGRTPPSRVANAPPSLATMREASRYRSTIDLLDRT